MQEIDFTNCEEYGMTIRDNGYIKTKENERCNEEEIRVIIAVSDRMGFYNNFDKIFVKDKSIVEKIENFLKEKSYALMEYPHYEDIYFDEKASGELTIYGYEKRVFQKAFLGINDEIDAYIKTHMRMRGIKFSIIKM